VREHQAGDRVVIDHQNRPGRPGSTVRRHAATRLSTIRNTSSN
jgi:hypothetical protein